MKKKEKKAKKRKDQQVDEEDDDSDDQYEYEEDIYGNMVRKVQEEDRADELFGQLDNWHETRNTTTYYKATETEYQKYSVNN